MTNDEIRRNDEIRMTKPAITLLGAFRHSGFGFLSSFVIRHSTTYANQVHAPKQVVKVVGAFHEPPGEGTGPTGCRPGPLTRRVERFMVPMHAEIARGLSMNRRRPARFWIAPSFWRFGNGGEPTKS